MISDKEMKEYYEKQYSKCPHCGRKHRIMELDFLLKNVNKRKLKKLNCHLRHAFYVGSYRDKEGRIIDVFNARDELQRLGFKVDQTYVITIGEPNEKFEEEKEEEDLITSMKAYPSDFGGSYVYYDDEDTPISEGGE